MQSQRKIGQDIQGEGGGLRLRSRQADRQIKQSNQLRERCLLPVLSVLLGSALSNPVFKASAGGGTLSSALWFLYKIGPCTFCRDYAQPSSFICSSFWQPPPLISLRLIHREFACLWPGWRDKTMAPGLLCFCHGGFNSCLCGCRLTTAHLTHSSCW